MYRRNKLRSINYRISAQSLQGRYSVPLLVVVLLFSVALFFAAGVLVGADGRLDRIVAQKHLSILIQVIETFRFRPV